MTSLRRSREKLNAAVHALAVREGDVRQRLRSAHFYLRQLSEEDLPREHRAEFLAITSALTASGPDVGPDGSVFKRALDNTLDQIRNSRGRQLAERIYALARSLR